MKNQFKTIEQVWTALDQGQTVYWSSKAYKLTIEDARIGTIECREYWLNHHTFRNGKVLRKTCISNWFGSLLDANDLNRLFTE